MHRFKQPQTKSLRVSRRVPAQVYLWLAVLIFGASNAVTRKITELGAENFVGGENPISLCNVLFVGNLCALSVLLMIHRHEWRRTTLRLLSRQEWLYLGIVAVLSGAFAPALIFQSLALTPVTNVVLITRIEPPITLALSVWLLHDRVNRWQVGGAIAAFVGVVLTIVLPATPQATAIAMAGFTIDQGTVLAATGAIALAISTIVGKKQLSNVSLGLYSIVRTGVGTMIFFVVALVLYGHDHFAGVLSPFLWQWMLLYGVIIVVVGQSFWTVGLRSTSVATAAVIGSFAPIAGILAAYLLLGEVPTGAQYIGGCVILAGLLLSQWGTQSSFARQIHTVKRLPTEQAIESNMGFKGI